MKKLYLPKLKIVIRTLLILVFTFFVALYAISFFFPAAASFSERWICYPLRIAISEVSSTIAIPIFEVAAVAIPIILVLSLIRFLRGGRRPIFPVFLLCFLFVAYVVTLGIGANLPSEKTYDPFKDISLAGAEEQLALRINELSETLENNEPDVSCVHRLIGKNTPYPKRTFLPNLLSRSGIFASFYFPTAEIVINGSAPDFVSAFSLAHEIMHFRGVTSEDEATYLAYVALSETGAAELEYSAELYAFILIGERLSREDYSGFISRLNENAKAHVREYYTFCSFGRGRVGKVSEALNDLAISARDKRGIDSYRNAAYLIAAYLDANDRGN